MFCFFSYMSCLIQLLLCSNQPQNLRAYNDRCLFSHSLVFSWGHFASGYRSSRVTVPLISFWGQTQVTETTKTCSPRGGGQKPSGGQPQPDRHIPSLSHRTHTTIPVAKASQKAKLKVKGQERKLCLEYGGE